MAVGATYSPTQDQPALTTVFDLNVARAASPSFDKCHREVDPSSRGRGQSRSSVVLFRVQVDGGAVADQQRDQVIGHTGGGDHH